MTTLIAINLTWIEYSALAVVVIIFIGTIYFFIKSRKNLQETLKGTGLAIFSSPKEDKHASQKRSNKSF